MKPRPIVYNLVRLILSASHSTPRGVERIDFGFLNHLLDHWPEDVVGVVPSAIGYRYFGRARVKRGVARLAQMWGETPDEATQTGLDRLKRQIEDPASRPPDPPIRQARPGLAGFARMFRLVMNEGFDLGKPMSAAPAGALYLDIGHFGVNFPMAFHWRAARPDISPVFMIHDVIPLEFPELIPKKTVEEHRKLMALTAKHAEAVITPSGAAAAAVKRVLAEFTHRNVPIYPVSLPIDEVFNRSVTPDPALTAHPYFVICGAIEPRKNHALLIRIWRDLVDSLGEAAPYLFIAGSPTHASKDFVSRLAQSPSLRRHVFIVSGLSSPALARLIAGARALLMPSFAEGFGLPPVEALALGTPSLLSDIPPHRDAAGASGLFLDPIDGPAWRRAIETLACDEKAYRARRRAIADFTPQRWPGYMRAIEGVLGQITT